MNILKKKATQLLLSLALIPLLLPGYTAKAANQETIFTYGESLTQPQLKETERLLNVPEKAKALPVYIKELNGLLQDTYPYSQVYSSTLITPTSNKGKVTVEILTPKTITAITPLQYENAALTAGATNVNIKVASAVEVDGSGALAGVYKAFQNSGKALNKEAVIVAQDELRTASNITKDNKNKPGYSDEALNAAIADMKTQIQQTKAKNGGSIDGNTIQLIVNNVINNYHLDQQLSPENIQQLQNLMHRFSQIELTEEQKKAISHFGKTLADKSGKLVDSAKSAWNNMDAKDKEGIMNFFRELWVSFKNLINSFLK